MNLNQRAVLWRMFKLFKFTFKTDKKVLPEIEIDTIDTRHSLPLKCMAQKNGKLFWFSSFIDSIKVSAAVHQFIHRRPRLNQRHLLFYSTLPCWPTLLPKMQWLFICPGHSFVHQFWELFAARLFVCRKSSSLSSSSTLLGRRLKSQTRYLLMVWLCNCSSSSSPGKALEIISFVIITPYALDKGEDPPTRKYRQAAFHMSFTHEWQFMIRATIFMILHIFTVTICRRVGQKCLQIMLSFSFKAL